MLRLLQALVHMLLQMLRKQVQKHSSRYRLPCHTLGNCHRHGSWCCSCCQSDNRNGPFLARAVLFADLIDSLTKPCSNTCGKFDQIPQHEFEWGFVKESIKSTNTVVGGVAGAVYFRSGCNTCPWYVLELLLEEQLVALLDRFLA